MVKDRLTPSMQRALEFLGDDRWHVAPINRSSVNALVKHGLAERRVGMFGSDRYRITAAGLIRLNGDK